MACPEGFETTTLGLEMRGSVVKYYNELLFDPLKSYNSTRLTQR